MKNVDYNVRAANAINPTNQVGKISKTFGNNGQLVIKLWDNFPDNTCEPLWVSIDSLAVPLFIASYEKQGTSKAVVTFDDFLTESLASMLVGLNIFAENPQTEQDEDSVQSELIGLKFIDNTSNTTGLISDFFDDPYNPLLELSSEALEEPALVPFNENFIDHFDKRKKIITFNLPEGIFDL